MNMLRGDKCPYCNKIANPIFSMRYGMNYSLKTQTTLDNNLLIDLQVNALLIIKNRKMVKGRYLSLIGLCMINLCADQIFAQANCSAGPTYPTIDSSVTNGPPPSDAYASAFTITLEGGAGNGDGSFTGFTISELDA